VRSSELTTGRTFAVAFGNGRDFFAELQDFCIQNEVQQGYIPFFIARFSNIELIRACPRDADAPGRPWPRTRFQEAQAVGAGTLARDDENDEIVPHIHLSIGPEVRAPAYTGHLSRATVLFIAEMVIVEVVKPNLWRVAGPTQHGIGLLAFL